MYAIIVVSVLCSSAVPLALSPAQVPMELDFKSAFQQRNERVRQAVLNFNPPSLHQALLPPNNTPFDLYEKQTLRGLSGPMADAGSLSAGIAIFAAMTVLVARAPEPVRAIFDAPIRLGPAILRDGGFGAGLGGRW